MNVPVRFHKPLKIFFIVSSLVVVYSLIGFFLLPALLQWKLPEIIQQETGRKTLIEKVRFNPFLLTASLKGFQLQELKAQPFVAFENLDIDINSWQSIKQSALVFDKIWLNKLFAHIAKQKNGEFNFKDLIKPKAQEKKEDKGGLFPVLISKLSLTEGKLVFEDEHFATPVKEDVIPINLDIENFTTQADQQSSVGFSMALSSGGSLHWKGELGINPLRSSGHIKLDNIKLERIYELVLQDKMQIGLQGTELFEADYVVSYDKNALDLTIKQSKLVINEFQYTGKAQNNLWVKVPDFALEGAYKVNFTNNNLQFNADNTKIAIHELQLTGLNPDKVLFKVPAITLQANSQATIVDSKLAFTVNQGQFDVNGFELSEKDQQKTLVKVPALAIKGIGFNLNSQELAVDSVAVNDASFKAGLDRDGVLNYATLFSSPAQSQNNAPATTTQTNQTVPASNPWIINVNALAVNNLGVDFEDQTTKKPVTFNIKPVNLKVSKFSSKSGTKFPFQFSAGVNQTGSINLAGDSVIEPINLKSDIDVKTIDLDKFQPYVDKFARLDVIDGELNIKGNVAVEKTNKEQLDVKFKGNTGIDHLITRDQKLNKDLVKWKKLTLKDMNIDLLANRYTASALIIEKPYARVIIRKDKTINFADIAVAEKSKPQTPVKTAQKPPVKQSKPYFQLGKLQLIDGSSDFADLSLILPFAAPIESLDGGASGMSSEQKAKIKVDLKGTAYDLSPVDIKGEVSPQLGNYNVELNFQGMPMPLISPYMAQFAGYKVEKGKLTLGLKYNIENKTLTASNSILIDQFELGEKVENPDAVSLPLGLAIALLKDSNGRIKIDVPITGSLEDPKFSVGKLVFDALLNVLTKIVTSPFNAIASLIGSEEDLSVVSFAAGESKLDKQQMAKLDSIAKALKERPVLNLEIKGAAFQEQDWPALQDDALRDQIKNLKAAEVNKKSGRKTRAENIELSDEDFQKLLAQEFIRKFPLLAEKSLLGTPKLIPPATGDFYEVAKQKLAAIIKPEPQRLKDLAVDRAQAIAKYIVQKGGIPNEKVFILDTALDPKRENNDIVSALSLKTDGLK